MKHKLDGDEQVVTALGYSPDGRLLASADQGGKVRLWDVKRSKELRVLDAPKKTKDLETVVFSPDGCYLATAARDGLVHVWEVQTGKHLWGLSLPPLKPDELPPLDPLAGLFIPSEKVFLLAHNGRLLAWDLSTGNADKRFQQIEEQPIRMKPYGPCLLPSPDGRCVLRIDGGAWLYEATSGRIIYRFPGNYTTASFHPSLARLALADEERLGVLIYDLPTVFRYQPTRSNPSTSQQLWENLGDRDARQAYAAVSRLGATPGMEAFLARKLIPVAPVEREKLEKNIANLGSDDYPTRQKATEILAEAGELAQPALQQAMRTTRDLEQRLRLKRLLSLLGPHSRDRMRNHRAIFALEMRGTPEARRLLQTLATGAPRARLTQEAKAALQRLCRRPASVP